MKWNIFAIIFVTLAFTVGCEVKGDPIELSKACDIANDGKNFQVSGVFKAQVTILCSNTSGRRECSLGFADPNESESKMTADIALGSGANTMDEVPKGFKSEDLKVRDNNGDLIAVGKDVVKVTGKLSVGPPSGNYPGPCFIQVYKIEK